jgi:hypothetical protein
LRAARHYMFWLLLCGNILIVDRNNSGKRERTGFLNALLL